MMASLLRHVRPDPAGLRTNAGTPFAASLMAQALAALFAAGATLALLTVALPHPRQASELALLVIVGIAYVVGGLLFWRASRVSRAMLRVALAWGSTLIAAVAYFSAQSPSPLVFFFVWVVLYSSYFFTTRQTAFQVLYVAVAYGALLIARTPKSGAAEWWLVGMGTLLVAAVLIGSMRERVEQLISRLYDAARTDPLTGLSNRRAFRELLDLEIERARRSGTQVTVVVGDADRFKELNDRRGQAVGDEGLRRIARVLDSNKRALDALARVAGDRFALILADADQHQAFAKAESLRDRVRDEFEADTIPLTVSFGVASYPQHGETAASLVHAADTALRAAKQSGRDRTVLHSEALASADADQADPRDLAGERFIAVVLDLAEAVDLRFSGSARHAETVGRYTEMMARELGLAEDRVARVALAGTLHDIGKVGVPDTILQKPGKLTDEEFAVIKTHPGLGAQILEHPSLGDVRTWVGAHHERPDGRGYPLGLSGDRIPLEARILAVADAYEAMTSDRAYRASLGPDAAHAELERCAGSQFDPRVVRALLDVLARETERAAAEPAAAHPVASVR
jgi:diguanylate cyclase (GGDEF)-like protein